MKTLVKEARTNMLKEFFSFLFGYAIMTSIVMLTDFFEKDQDGSSGNINYFSSFRIFIYILELFKFALDQILVVLFFKLMYLQR